MVNTLLVDICSTVRISHFEDLMEMSKRLLVLSVLLLGPECYDSLTHTGNG